MGCTEQLTCEACAGLTQCGWCSGTSTCQDGTPVGSSDGCSPFVFYPSSCSASSITAQADSKLIKGIGNAPASKTMFPGWAIAVIVIVIALGAAIPAGWWFYKHRGATSTAKRVQTGAPQSMQLTDVSNAA